MLRSAKIIQAAYKCFPSKPNITNPYKIIARNSSVTTWNKDWQPGPYPRTEEERIAAAKKYNLLPEDYEPYPEEEGFGDYPKFPPYHAESRNQHEPFDYPSILRNYGEPVHPDFDLCYEDRTNFQRKFKTPIKKQVLYVFSAVALYSSIIYFAETFRPEANYIPKQFPHTGQVHYSFESAEQ